MELWLHEVSYIAKALEWADQAPDTTDIDKYGCGFYIGDIVVKNSDGTVYGRIRNNDGLAWSFVFEPLHVAE